GRCTDTGAHHGGHSAVGTQSTLSLDLISNRLIGFRRRSLVDLVIGTAERIDVLCPVSLDRHAGLVEQRRTVRVSEVTVLVNTADIGRVDGLTILPDHRIALGVSDIAL